MGFELPDGKTARNIQEQVAFLTEKLKDLYAAFNELGIKKIEIVEALPETGQEGILYLVPEIDPLEGDYYKEYIWLDNEWELIGSTKIDLSNYVTLDGEQTISAIKTHTAKIIFNVENNTQFLTAATFNLEKDGNGKIILGQANNDIRFYDTNIRVASPLLRPQTTNYTDLGSNDYRYKDIFIDGKFYTGRGTNQLIYGDAYNRTCINNGFWFSALRMEPMGGDNAQDIGTGTNRIRDLFIGRNLSDGTNSATVADIAALITYAKAQGWIS